MHPPDWVCKEVERVNPWARLAWAGDERGPDDPLNKGTFALIDLYPKRQAAVTFRERWGDRGPIFGRPFDLLQRVPIWVENIPATDVFSGKIVKRVKSLVTTTLAERMAATHREEAGKRKRARKEIAGEAADHLRYQARHNPYVSASATIANKHVSQAEKDRCTGDWEPQMDKMDEVPKPHPIALV